MRMGASGVAIGTLIGGFASIGMHFFYNLPRTTKIFIANKSDLISAIIKPILLVLFPTVLVYIFSNSYTFPISTLVSTIVIFINWIILWKYGLDSEDRHVLLSAVKKAVKKN